MGDMGVCRERAAGPSMRWKSWDADGDSTSWWCSRGRCIFGLREAWCPTPLPAVPRHVLSLLKPAPRSRTCLPGFAGALRYTLQRDRQTQQSQHCSSLRKRSFSSHRFQLLGFSKGCFLPLIPSLRERFQSQQATISLLWVMSRIWVAFLHVAPWQGLLGLWIYNL